MSERTALVTGVSSGIGAGVAARLLDEGWAVLGTSRREPEVVPQGLTWTELDLADADATSAFAESSPPVQAVIHAAGVLRTAPLGSLDFPSAEQMWRLHVEAPAQLLNVMASRLPDGARVVLVGSRTSRGAAGKSQYAASKAALVGMARSWASELAPRRITVNVVAPGPTETPMLIDPGRAGLAPVMPPLGRFVSPSEVAALVSLLVGEHGGSITGQELVICAGASL